MTTGSTHVFPDLVAETAREAWDSSRLQQLFLEFEGTAATVLDVGRSDVGTELAGALGALRVVKRSTPGALLREPSAGPGFVVSTEGERFDLAVLVDSLHEVYARSGRRVRGGGRIDRRAGLDGVRCELESVASTLVPGGVIALTMDVLCEEAVPVVIRARSRTALETVRRFVAEFTAQELDVRFHEGQVFEINSRDLCILLSAYEWLRSGAEVAWETERTWVRPFMTASDARRLTSQLGLVTRSIHAPLDDVFAAECDFDLLAGLPTLPNRRLAIAGLR